MMSFYLKDPGARVSYAIDWTAYLGAHAIAGSAWSVSPVESGGLAIESAGHDFKQTSATVSGGLAGHIYSVVNRVTLSDGQVDERSITLRVEQR